MTYIIYNDFSLCSPTIISEQGFSAMDEPLEAFEAESFDILYEELLARKPQNKVPIIICYPLKEAAISFISPDLKSLQSAVQGNIEIISLRDYPGVDILCNEDGKINKMKLNRGIYSNNNLIDVVAGPMVFIGCTPQGEHIGLSRKTLEKIYYSFLEPEVFIIDRRKNKVNSIKCSTQTAEIMRENNISIIG